MLNVEEAEALGLGFRGLVGNMGVCYLRRGVIGIIFHHSLLTASNLGFRDKNSRLRV